MNSIQLFCACVRGVGLMLLVGWLVATPLSAAPAKPNVLFLFADDHCYEAIRALGLTDIDTPNLDRLVKQGTTFTRAYNMGSWQPAVCVASRTMLITGRSLWSASEIYNATDAERAAGRLWPQLMSRAGYQTFFTGKWHIKTDAAKAFDLAKDIRPGMPKDTPEAYNRPLDGQPDPWSPSDPKWGGFWQGGRHWSEVVADHAVDFLARERQSGKPFFMYVAFNAPHDPRQSPAEYVAKYPLERMQLPASFLPLYPHKDAIGCSPTARDEKLAPFPRTERAVKVHRQEYYAIITHMDAQIGRILEALEKSGEAANTWIVFTADHGLAVGHHGLFGKQNMYEHSLRVPFIVTGPGVRAGRKIDSPIYLQDVMPTALELAGAAKPEQVFFQSVLPLLTGKQNNSFYPAIYGAYLDLQRAVIEDQYKLILYPKVSVTRLYHLASDPLELKDLAGDPSQAARKAQLLWRLQTLQKELGDTLVVQ